MTTGPAACTSRTPPPINLLADYVFLMAVAGATITPFCVPHRLEAETPEADHVGGSRVYLQAGRASRKSQPEHGM